MSDGFTEAGQCRLSYERAGELVAERVPGGSKRVIAEADQLVNVAKPERFDRLALDFLAFAG